jgi:hypothetical protein
MDEPDSPVWADPDAPGEVERGEAPSPDAVAPAVALPHCHICRLTAEDMGEPLVVVCACTSMPVHLSCRETPLWRSFASGRACPSRGVCVSMQWRRGGCNAEILLLPTAARLVTSDIAFQLHHVPPTRPTRRLLIPSHSLSKMQIGVGSS